VGPGYSSQLPQEPLRYATPLPLSQKTKRYESSSSITQSYIREKIVEKKEGERREVRKGKKAEVRIRK